MARVKTVLQNLASPLPALPLRRDRDLSTDYAAMMRPIEQGAEELELSE